MMTTRIWQNCAATLEKGRAPKNRSMGVTTAKRNNITLDFDEGPRNWSNRMKPHQKMIIIPKPIRTAESMAEFNWSLNSFSMAGSKKHGFHHDSLNLYWLSSIIWFIILPLDMSPFDLTIKFSKLWRKPHCERKYYLSHIEIHVTLNLSLSDSIMEFTPLHWSFSRRLIFQSELVSEFYALFQINHIG